MSASVRPGLEVLATDSSALLAGRRFALLANQATVSRDLTAGWSLLAGVGGVEVRLFAPEHGLWGTAQDMESVSESVEPSTGLRVHSLYGSSPATFAPRAELLDDLDAVVVDLPDIGTRYYTFAATMAHVMAACSRAGVEVVVCDRPNPIGGETLEGGPIAPGLASFVSEVPVPARHGMTLGELALWLREARHPDLHLTVVACQGWKRRMWWEETGLPWVAPSPNMPTPTTAAIYPGGCLLEATNLSEGRGTTRP
ncbi:MAG: exo-beta-N-acetylmuramidase NamZ family protein, partial [Acidobacteriota bacterium]